MQFPTTKLLTVLTFHVVEPVNSGTSFVAITLLDPAAVDEEDEENDNDDDDDGEAERTSTDTETDSEQ